MRAILCGFGVKENPFRIFLIFRKSHEAELEVIVATPGISLILLFDFVVLFMLVRHLEERLMIVIDSESE